MRQGRDMTIDDRNMQSTTKGLLRLTNTLTPVPRDLTRSPNLPGHLLTCAQACSHTITH